MTIKFCEKNLSEFQADKSNYYRFVLTKSKNLFSLHVLKLKIPSVFRVNKHTDMFTRKMLQARGENKLTLGENKFINKHTFLWIFGYFSLTA